VWLVGAGPGPPDLLTLRAARLLETAEVVVYDDLVSQDSVELANPGAEQIYVGSACGSPLFSLAGDARLSLVQTSQRPRR